MLECLFHRDALDGVEGEELLKEVQSQVRGLGEHGLEGDLLLEGKGADVLACAARFDSVVVLHGWRAKDVEDERQLMVVCGVMLVMVVNEGSKWNMEKLTILSWEERLSAEHLSENAAHTPYVNGLSIFLERQHDLRCTVPARSHVFRHESRVVFLRGC